MNIKDFAKVAGVSVATVSKIMNGKDSGISMETRQRVLRLAKEYQYTPYASIKNSTAQNSYTVALLADFSDPVYDPVMRGAEQTLGSYGYALMVMNYEGAPDRLTQALYILGSKNINALLLLAAHALPEEALDILREFHVPVMLLNAGQAASFPRLDIDYMAAADLALRQMLSYGHTRIGCILERDSFQGTQIAEAYTHFCYENDIRFDRKYIYDARSGIEGGQMGFQQLSHLGATAVLCQNEEIAKGAYLAAESYGTAIPDDISLVGLASGRSHALLHPNLSVVHISASGLGARAAQAVIDTIERGGAPSDVESLGDHSFILGSSLSAPRESFPTKSKVVVVGSLNMDIMIHVPGFPQPGETVLSPLIAEIPGGKGANQAAGVGKLGGNVYMIGRLGNDREGKQLYQSLYENNVNLDGVTIEDDCATGKAYIHVASSGESTIVVYPGANRKLSPMHIRQSASLFQDAEYCLISTETLPETVYAVVKTARQHGVRIVLKPSAVAEISPQVLDGLYLLIPNEKEINYLLPDQGITLEEKARHFLSQGVQHVIVTLGENGAMLCSKSETVYFPAADFQPVDTTGAADSFISALVVALTEANDLHHAIRFATYAAGITVTRQGVQPALPDRMTMRLYADKITS